VLLVTGKAKLIVRSVKVPAYCQRSVTNAKARASCRLLLALDQLNATYAMVAVLSRQSAKSASAAGDLPATLAVALEALNRLNTLRNHGTLNLVKPVSTLDVITPFLSKHESLEGAWQSRIACTVPESQSWKTEIKLGAPLSLCGETKR